jgi:hypothetical protein
VSTPHGGPEAHPGESPTKEAYTWLHDLLTAERKRFSDESDGHKRLDRRSRMGALVLAAVTTIVGSSAMLVPTSDPQTITKIEFTIVCLTAAATGLAGWAETRRARELWVIERELSHAMEDLRGELELRMKLQKLTVDDVERLYERRATILASSSRRWGLMLGKSKGEDHDEAPAKAPGSAPAAKGRPSPPATASENGTSPAAPAPAP